MNGRTALHFAAENGSSTIAKQISSRYPSTVNVRDLLGRNALHYGVLSSDEKTVQVLCDETGEQLEVNAKDKSGMTALMLVARSVGKFEGNINQKSTHTAPKNLFTNIQTQLPISSKKELALIGSLLKVNSIDLLLTDNAGDNALIIVR